MNALAMQSIDVDRIETSIVSATQNATYVLICAPLVVGVIWFVLHLISQRQARREYERKFAVKVERWADRAAELMRIRQELHGWLVDEAFGLALRAHTLSTDGAENHDRALMVVRDLASALEIVKVSNAAAIERLSRRMPSDPIGDQRIPTLHREWQELDRRCEAVDALLVDETGTGHRVLLGERPAMTFESLVAPGDSGRALPAMSRGEVPLHQSSRP